MVTFKVKATHSRTLFRCPSIAGMAMVMLATLFLVSCIDHGGMMEEMEKAMQEMEKAMDAEDTAHTGDMTEPEPEEDTFFTAVERGDIQAARAFLEGETDVNARDASESTALRIAVRNNDVEMMRMLIEAGADPTLRYQDENSILCDLADGDAGEALKVLIEAGADLEARNDRGETPLIFAAATDQPSLPLLIRAGADIDTPDTHSYTALMRAALSGHVEALRALIEAGANVHLLGQMEDTALIYAAGLLRPNMEVFKLDETAVTAMVELLVDAGADVNARNSDTFNGFTPLLAAAKEGHAGAVELLIKAGADVNARTASGETALMLASAKGYTDVVAILQKAGANE